MKSLRLSLSSTKKGSASLYVVVFATVLFGVITLSFARIMLSEAEQSSNDDLSQSAYDSALAGVEDAKYMVNQYYRCLGNNGPNCDKYNIFAKADEVNDCKKGFLLGNKMHGAEVGKEILIQETSQNNSNGSNNSSQAYTCVIVSDVVPDYRGTLTSDTRTKVIPLSFNTATGSNGNTENIKKVKRIRFSWYSQLNTGDTNSANQFNLADGNTLPQATNKTIPPTVSLTLLTTGDTIDLNLLHKENNDISTGVIYSQMLLLPDKATTGGGEANNTISSTDINNAGNAVNDNGESLAHEPFEITCSTDTEFACNVDLQIGDLFKNVGNAFLVVSLPYGDAFTDFAVTMYEEGGNSIELRGVQISVDSTGRTDQLYRRVETRLDPADLFFPYPQFEIELTDSKSELKKNFWITANCWRYQYKAGGSCNNNGE